MKKNLQSEFQTRQYMLSKDFEISLKTLYIHYTLTSQ